jgi:hypothetical protein
MKSKEMFPETPLAMFWPSQLWNKFFKHNKNRRIILVRISETGNDFFRNSE